MPVTAPPPRELPATRRIPEGVAANLFQELQLGPLAPFQIVITGEDAARWARIHDDGGRWYAKAGSGRRGDDCAPPYILYFATMNTLAPIREFTFPTDASARPGGFARYQAEFVAPLPLDVPLEVRGAVLDRFVRRGRGYTVWGLEAFSGGSLLQRTRFTWATGLTGSEGEQPRERPDEPRPPEPPPAAETLSPVRFLTSLERMTELEDGERNSHTDVDAAVRAGRPAPLAQGEFAFALLARLVGERFGPSFAIGGTLDVRFVAPVYAGEWQTARGAVLARADGSVTCRVWSEKVDGALNAVGLATARDATSS